MSGTATSVPVYHDVRVSSLALVLLLVSCGGDEGGRPVRVWFSTQGESLRAVERDIPARPRSLLHALLAGPTPAERDAGLTTELPGDVELRGVSPRNGVARVSLDADMPPYEPNTVTFALRLAQLVHTLTELPQVERVRIDVAGRAWGFRRHDGSLIRTYTRRSVPVVCAARSVPGRTAPRRRRSPRRARRPRSASSRP